MEINGVDLIESVIEKIRAKRSKILKAQKLNNTLCKKATNNEVLNLDRMKIQTSTYKDNSLQIYKAQAISQPKIRQGTINKTFLGT